MLAVLYFCVDLTRGVCGLLYASVYVFSGVCKGETHEGGEVVEDGATFQGEVLPYD